MVSGFNVRILNLDSPGKLRAEMEKIGPTNQGIAIMTPKGTFRAVKLEGLNFAAANIVKQEMLSKGGEVVISREVYSKKDADSDVLLLGTLRHYQALLKKLRIQPFKSLVAIASEVERALARYAGEELHPLTIAGRTFNWGERTYVMGIINVTPDSFSGDGLGDDVEAALEQARRMMEEGADIIDVGGESTRPGSEPISPDEELSRVIPVIEGLAQVAARHQVPLVLMHNRSRPKDAVQTERLGGRYLGVEYKDLMGDIIRELRESIALALEAGVEGDKIVVDPGIGFGKTVEQNFQVMAHLAELKVLGRPILVGPSRKSFIGYTLDLPPEERVEGTAAAVAIGIAHGADIFRVHDVKEMVRVARMTDAIVR
jgi:dihydropteroate synthase